jgi:hypothetical protein
LFWFVSLTGGPFQFGIAAFLWAGNAAKTGSAGYLHRIEQSFASHMFKINIGFRPDARWVGILRKRLGFPDSNCAARLNTRAKDAIKYSELAHIAHPASIPATSIPD